MVITSHCPNCGNTLLEPMVVSSYWIPNTKCHICDFPNLDNRKNIVDDYISGKSKEKYYKAIFDKDF